MTEIKSALEIALERTKDIQGDKETIIANERRNLGKRIASKYLNPAEEKSDPGKELKQHGGQEGAYVREGFFQTLLANLSLPSDEAYKDHLKRIESGLLFVMKERRQVGYLIQQIDQFFEQYLQTRDQVTEQLKQQYEPQLREKEKQLAQQMGAQIHLTPESDPEFANLLSKNLARLEEQYNQALGQAKDELSRMFRPGK